MPPVIDFIRSFRELITTDKTMITKTIADFRTAFDAVQVAAGDASELLAAITGLFGAVPMMGAAPQPVVGGFVLSWRRRHMVEHVKQLTQREVRKGCDVPSQGVVLQIPAKTDFNIADIWTAAQSAGAEHLIVDELHKIDGFTALMEEGASINGEVGAIGDGKIWAWIQKAIQWVVDHQDQLLAIAKILLSFLLALGLI